jgi:hypothetical protein
MAKENGKERETLTYMPRVSPIPRQAGTPSLSFKPHNKTLGEVLCDPLYRRGN